MHLLKCNGDAKCGGPVRLSLWGHLCLSRNTQLGENVPNITLDHGISSIILVRNNLHFCLPPLAVGPVLSG